LGNFAIVVIGASRGGVDALQKLVAGLPRDIPAGLFMVQHIGRQRSCLPDILARRGSLPAVHATGTEEVGPGKIYVAPPDHHLILENGRVRLTRGPRENWARPAIDPLFRSAAAVYGQSVVGVILTGALNDGTAGLRAVRLSGGTAVVQHPQDATCPDMPVSALRHAGADYCVPLRDMAPLLTRLAEDVINDQQDDKLRAGGHTHARGV